MTQAYLEADYQYLGHISLRTFIVFSEKNLTVDVLSKDTNDPAHWLVDMV